MTEPKPLDWKDIEKKAEELVFEVDQVIDWKIEPKGEWEEDVIRELIRRDVKIFSRVDYAIEWRDAEELLEEIKQRIKAACEFYLRYLDNPELLIREHIVFKTAIEKLFNIEGKLRNDGTITRDIPEEFDYPKIPLSKSIYYDYKKYNKWLFKLAFKSIFEEKENELEKK
ncbi:MAG: hypothetical protein DRJ34_01510 [Thermoprotei archaeon]|nr:MAG: hypothetical protein DRJ34_01510 [Thermoprotei archaeon]